MKTFDQLYPDLPNLDFAPGDNSMMACKDLRPCVMCKTLTRFIEINFCAFICSQACEDALDEEYRQACMKSKGQP